MPAVDRRWLGEEYRDQSNRIDPYQEPDVDKQQALVRMKNDLSFRAEQQIGLAVDNSSLLNQPLLKQASEQLAVMMHRTFAGNPELTREFSEMNAKISGVGSDQTESLTDMVYQKLQKVGRLAMRIESFRRSKRSTGKGDQD